MSYDICLRHEPCPTCGQTKYPEGRELPGPTYNLTPIFDLALTGEPLPNDGTSEFEVVILHKETDRPRGLRLLNGRKAKDTLPWLQKACAHLLDPAREAEFRALEPPNKWGDLKGARDVMQWLRDAAELNPEFTWEIH